MAGDVVHDTLAHLVPCVPIGLAWVYANAQGCFTDVGWRTCWRGDHEVWLWAKYGVKLLTGGDSRWGFGRSSKRRSFGHWRYRPRQFSSLGRVNFFGANS